MKFSGHIQNRIRKKFGCDPDHCLDLLDPGIF